MNSVKAQSLFQRLAEVAARGGEAGGAGAAAGAEWVVGRWATGAGYAATQLAQDGRLGSCRGFPIDD